MKLAGSTLLETLVATILFLLIFGIAIEALVRINKVGNVDWVSMERVFNQWRDSEIPAKDTTSIYPWGTMQWEVTSDAKLSELRMYTVTAYMKNGQTAVYYFFKD